MDQDRDGTSAEAIEDRYDASFAIYTGPYVTSHFPSGNQYRPISELFVEFNEPLLETSFTAEDVTVTGPNGQVQVSLDPVHMGNNRYRIVLPEQSADGTYHVYVGPDIQNVSGVWMDQDGDQVAPEPIDDRYDASFSIFTGPYVTSHSPSGDQVGSVSTMDITFSDPIDPSTLAPDDFQVTGPAGPIALVGNPTHLSDNTYQIGFASQSAYGIYHVYVGPHMANLLGMDMDQDRDGVLAEPVEDRFDASFTIIDVSGPHITGYSPDMPVQGPLEYVDFDFSEPMNSTTFTTADVTVQSPGGPITPTAVEALDIGHFRVNLPGQSLEGTYLVSVGPDIADVVGNVMDQDGDGQKGEPDDVFTASVKIDQTPPIVLDHSLDELQYAIVSRFEVTFNEAIDAATFLRQQVSVTGPQGTQVASGVTRLSDTTFRVAIAGTAANGLFDVTIGGAVADLAGNTLAQPYTFTFQQLLPDLRITNVAYPSECVSGQEIEIQWTVSNTGEGVATGGWVDVAYWSLDNTPSADDIAIRLRFDQPLPPMESYTRAASFTVPALIEGNRWIIVVTDSYNELGEVGGDSGNVFVASPPTWVTTRAYADLQVADVMIPDTLSGGEMATVSWSVRNLGNGPTSATFWHDKVFLSTDTVLGASDIELASIPNPDFLSPGDSYTQTVGVTVPYDTPRGEFYLIVKTDAEDREEEFGLENNNVGHSANTGGLITPTLGFLTVVSFEDPGIREPGSYIGLNELTWTLQNTGGSTIHPSPTHGYWDDGLAISRDVIYDEGKDLWLGGHLTHHEQPLGPGQTRLSRNDWGVWTWKTIRLPDWSPGTYFLILIPDTHWIARTQGREVPKNYGVVPITLAYPPPDLSVTSVAVPSGAAAGQAIEVDWRVQNQGSGGTRGASWTDRIHLSSDRLLDGGDVAIGSRFHSGALGAGNSYNVSAAPARIPGNLTEGLYYVLIQSDANSSVQESDEANNVRASANPMTVTQPVECDLQILSADGPDTGIADESVTFQWAVVNSGLESTLTGVWSDAVYLSEDEVLDTLSDRRLGILAHQGILGSAQEYHASLAVRLPTQMDGVFNLLVVTDNGDDLYEPGSEHNNVYRVPHSIQIADIAPDLMIADFSSPAVAIAGRVVDVDWLITNAGTNEAAPGWQGAVYLSRDDTLDPADDRLATFTVEQPLPPGNSVGPPISPVQLALPDGIEGTYYLILVADSGQNVYEKGLEDNNVLTRPISLTDLAPDLAISEFSVPATAIAGRTLDVDWLITNVGTEVATPGWEGAVYLSRDDTVDPEDGRLVTFTVDQPLASGNNVGPLSSPVEIALPDGMEGTYYLILVADSQETVYEKGIESNNVLTRPLSVTDLVPDLHVQSAVADRQGRAGEYITADYAAVNTGEEAAIGTWKEVFYLSADDQFDPQADRLFGQVEQTGPLGVGQTYGPRLRPTYLRLPDRTEGTYRIFLVVDSGNAVDEKANETNNVYLLPDPIQIALTPADLLVSDVQIPAAATAGTMVSVAWTVTDDGPKPTEESLWRDGIYLSADANFEPAGDIELGVITHTGVLGPGESYAQRGDFALRPDLEGLYFLYVAGDVRHQVFEHDGEDNNITAAGYRIAVTGVHADLQVTGIQAPATVLIGSEVQVGWTVTNIGPDATPGSHWTDSVHLSEDGVLDASDRLLDTLPHNARLPDGGSYRQSRSLPLPQDAIGTFSIIVKTDSSSRNDLYEYQAEGNNTAAAVIELLPIPPADLEVTQIVAPTAAWSGQTMLVQWTVTNTGGTLAEAQRGGWFDSVYLSRDPYLDRQSDLHLGAVLRGGSVAASGGFYAAGLDSRLPPGISGPFYVFVVVDTTNRLFERDAEDNNATLAASTVQINLTPPADLIVTQVSAPPSGSVGETALWNYEVSNAGTADAVGEWYDTLYLSADRSWDLDDMRIARVRHTGDLSQGQSYSQTVSANVPAIMPGEYYLIARTDILNQVRESTADAQNNIAVSTERVVVDCWELAFDIPDSAHQLQTGSAHYFAIPNVPEGRSLLVRLDVASETASTSIFVSHGQLPTRSRFDATSHEPSNSDQHLVVPTTKEGSYFVLVYADRIPSGSVGYSVEAAIPDFAVYDQTYGQGGTAGNLTIEVNGVGFDRTVKARLADASGFELPASEHYYVDGTRLYATFDLTQTAAGYYDVIVHNEEGATATIVAALQVVPGGGGTNRPEINVPSLVRFGREFQFQVSWSNDGLNDALVPVLTVEGTLPFGFSPNDRSAGNRYTFLGTSTDGGPAGVLRPGQRETISFFTYAHSDVDSFHFFVDRPYNDLQAAFDWNSVCGGTQHCTMSDEAYEMILEDVVAEVGARQVDFLRMLSRNATLLPTSSNRENTVLEKLLQVEWERVLALNSTSLQGRIDNDRCDVPLAGRNLAATNQSNGETYFATTFNDGSFVLPELTAGDYRVRLEGAVILNPDVIHVDSGKASTGVVLDVVRGGTVQGQVTDSRTGIGVAEALVVLIQGSDSRGLQALTDSKGVYRIDNIPRGTYRAQVIIAGWSQIASPQIDVIDSIGPVTMDLVVQLGSTLRGAVVDGTTMLPIVNATGQIHSEDGIVLRSFQTDALGNYVVRDILPGRHHIYVSQIGYATISEVTPLLAEGGESRLDLHLERLSALGGRVFTTIAPADPLPGIEIGLYRGSSLLSTKSTDVEGGFSFGNLEAGEYRLAALLGENPVATATAIVASGDASSTFDIALPVVGEIRGKVSGTGVTVSLSAAGGTLLQAVPVETDGSFRFGILSEGTYFVNAFSLTEIYPTQQVTISPGDIVQGLLLNPGSLTVQGHVSTPLGTYAESAHVVLRRADIQSEANPALSTIAGPNGEFSFSNVARVIISCTYPWKDSPQQAYPSRSASADVTDTSLTLAPACQITGEVRDSTGVVIPGSQVIALRSGSAVTEAIATTDEQGHFVLDGLRAGIYDLRVSANGVATLYISGVSPVTRRHSTSFYGRPMVTWLECCGCKIE